MGEPIAFEGLRNVRDLGGLPTMDGCQVKSGLLYRGGHLCDATVADCNELVRRGISEVIDLRSEQETLEKPDSKVPGMWYTHLPVVADVRMGVTRDTRSDDEIREMMTSGRGVDVEYVSDYMRTMYRMFVLDGHAVSHYARFVDCVLEAGEAGRPVYWHCTAGKDRAGFAAVILGEALGVKREALMEDYLLSNVCLADEVGLLMTALGATFESDDAREALRGYFVADEAYLRAAYDAAWERYGSFEGFLEQGLGIDATKRQRLAATFVE